MVAEARRSGRESSPPSTISTARRPLRPLRRDDPPGARASRGGHLQDRRAGRHARRAWRACSRFSAKKQPLPLSVMGMGRFGKISRLLFAQAGSVLNYGYLDRPNASGQWEATSLKKRLANSWTTDRRLRLRRLRCVASTRISAE